MTTNDIDTPFTPVLTYAKAAEVMATHGRKLTSDEMDAWIGAEDDTRIFYAKIVWAGDVGDAQEAYMRNGDDSKIEVYRLSDMACAFASDPDEPWDTY